MKRILSLDGGGIRGVFTLEILLRMQTLLRTHYDSPDLVLADHFDLFAGTSTGAIIAASLCWGMSVEEILRFYVEFGATMFTHVPWYRPIKRLFVSRFKAKPLSDLLQRVYSEDGEGKVPALLGTKRLKKLLVVIIRNHTTGNAWPVNNNPKGKFKEPGSPDSNLNIPLWKLVRASTAAPVYFDPEEIELGDKSFFFVDGGVTPYNNPALIAALTAVLPCYQVDWTPGPENIRMISLGTIRFSSGLMQESGKQWLAQNASLIPSALIQGISWEQDYLCRCLGQCLFGEELDSEIGNLVGTELPGSRWFSYVRYNQSFKAEKVAELLKDDPRLSRIDAVQAIPRLREIGQAYAEQHVRIEHLI